MLIKTAVFALLLLGACDKASRNDRGAPPGSAAPAHAGCKGDKCLPDVSFHDTDGKAYTLQDLTGKVVVVNFWATWCHPCQKEIPDLSKVSERYKDKGVLILGMLADNPDDDKLLNFRSDNEMTYPVIRMNSDINVSYGYPDQLPTTYVFDRSGTQVFSHVGALREEKLVELLEPLVAKR